MDNTEKKLTRENLKLVLMEFIEKNKLEVKDVARAIGCPSAVIGRVMCGITWASDELLKRCHTMLEIGYEDYKKLTEAQKEKISETIGVVGGAGLGVGVSITAVSTLGSVVGLGATGITSGLAALGTLVGGGMAAGIAVAAVIPLIITATSYWVVKAVKSGFSEAELKAEKFEPRWERPVGENI